MSNLTIAVVFGGCSNEYGVSLHSAASVLEHLDPSKYNIVMIGITQAGQWLRYCGDIEGILADRWHAHPDCCPAFFSPSREIGGLVELVDGAYRFTPVDVVFPVLHGRYGEDGTLQGLLELSGIPYVGCDTLSSALCMDKEVAHKLVQAAGIETARSCTVWKGEHLEDAAATAIAWLGLPLFVKPARSGSSIGITKAQTHDELLAGIKQAFVYDDKVTIEESIEGFEVGCAILGNHQLLIGEIDEIELTGDFFDFAEKYSLSTATIHLPARVDEPMANKIKETALQIYWILGCKGLARVDLFVTKEDKILFNEVNTLPGFTAASRYPNMMKACGISYSELLDQLVALAIAEGAKR